MSKKNFSTGALVTISGKKNSEKFIKEKKIPIIVGGTGLYFKSLINGMAKIPMPYPKILREQETIQFTKN